MGDYIVYKHTNKTNGKMYIGMTSQKAKDRWKNGRGYSNKLFREDIEKYGWEEFSHEIIADNLSRETAQQMERALIKELKTTDPNYGYNCTNGGEVGGMCGKHHTATAKGKIRSARKKSGFSEEHKRHISESKKGANHHFAKKVYQFSKEGEFIREWEYMSLAAKTLKISKGSIGEVCHGKRKSAGGYIWKYERR